NTDTVDAIGTARQCLELAEAGSELVRFTVNIPEAAAAVPEIKQRLADAGSLNQELAMAKMQENTDGDLGKSSEAIINECMVLSALQSTELALECGLR